MANLREQLLEARGTAERVHRSLDTEKTVEETRVTRINPFAVAGQEGLTVIRRPMDNMLGAYLRFPDRAAGIIINSERPTGLVNLTCAHELGHHFLAHPTTNDKDMYDHASPMERAADMFAYQLVAPFWIVKKNIQQMGLTRKLLANPLWQYQLSLRLGLSYHATQITLLNEEVITKAVFTESRRTKPAEIKRRILGPEITFDLRNDVWLVRETDQAVVLAPANRDLLVLEPSSASGSGYVWTIGQATKEGFELELAGDPDEPVDDVMPLLGGESVMKAATRVTEDIDVKKHPQQMLRFEEVRPWLKAPPARAMDFSLHFTEKSSGLDFYSRIARTGEG